MEYDRACAEFRNLLFSNPVQVPELIDRVFELYISPSMDLELLQKFLNNLSGNAYVYCSYHQMPYTAGEEWFQAGRYDSLQMCRERILSIYQNLVRQKKTRTIRNPAVLKAQIYMELHSGEAITLSDIASAADVTPAYLCTVFRKISGMTVHQSLERMRMEKAENLLRTTSLSLPEIAKICGFGSPRYFSRKFTEFSGFSPTAYRNQL